LHCLNVTRKQNALYLVDWDNAQIAPKELDFVKLAHWSRLGADGHFEPDSATFASFCAGYGAAGAVLASPISSSRVRLAVRVQVHLGPGWS
jgi:hypothetical protein